MLWLQSAQWFQRRRCLEMLTHTYIRTTEAYLSYKLTTEPKGSGELNTGFMVFSEQNNTYVMAMVLSPARFENFFFS